ncbi:MAG: hypothetical protein DWC07_03005 [Candidatus Poseidoniales archaeon]|nr:MAG: hypothetical protein DWC07_03005 [Candidatus Poseidoniales archaeon]
MPRFSLGTALVLLVLLSSTSGCMGLIAAREGVESLREPAFESLTNEKIEVSHQFTSPAELLSEFTNRSTFVVDEQTKEVRIYFRVSFTGSDFFSDNTTRYVRATLTDADGRIQWEQDVSEDAQPLEQRLEPNPEFSYGEWELEVRARGLGEDTLGTPFKDNFDIIVTITHGCMQYPLVDECY